LCALRRTSSGACGRAPGLRHAVVGGWPALPVSVGIETGDAAIGCTARADDRRVPAQVDGASGNSAHQRKLTRKEAEAVGLALMKLEETVQEIGKKFGLTAEDLNLDLGPLKLM
jgi:hypothetical protein